MDTVATTDPTSLLTQKIIGRTLLRRRPDWLMPMMVLVVALPTDAWEWFSEPRLPTSFEWGLLAFVTVLCLINPSALWKRSEVLILNEDGFEMPDKYEEPVDWGSVQNVSSSGQLVYLKIADGHRFGRKPTLYYRMFPEQKRYKGDDLQAIDCNEANITAVKLIALIEQLMAASHPSAA